MKLFLVYLGGTAAGANIELHDVRFVVGDTIESTYPQLKQQWFGTVKGLHLDSYVHIHHVDGYRIELAKTDDSASAVPMLDERLYFINYGGYFAGKIPEFHDFTLCVARSPQEAKQKGLAQVISTGLAGTVEPHKDDLWDVDDCLAIDLIEGWCIRLVEDGQRQPLKPDWSGYEVIGK